MNAKPFFDTNILLYLATTKAEKAERATWLLSEGGVISVQSLNEFVAVCRRKYRIEWAPIEDFTAIFRRTLDVAPLMVSTHNRAFRLSRRFGYTIYDSLILAAAAEAGSAILYSEDMRHGQRIDDLTIVNPFL